MKKNSTPTTSKTTGARLFIILTALVILASIITATAYMQQDSPAAPQPAARLDKKIATGAKDGVDKLGAAINQETALGPQGPEATGNYAFTTATNASLTDMSSGTTTIVAADQDDTASLVTNIGFDFYFQGARFTQFSANSNGLMRLGSTVVQGGSPYKPLAQASIPLIAPYGADQRTLATTGKVHFKVTGTAPNRTLVVEWLNMQSNFNAAGTSDLTYQARLSETTGVIEYVYGKATMSTSGAADTNSRDPNIGFSSSNTAGTVGSVTAAQSGTPAPTFNGASATPVANLYTAGTIPVLNSAADGSRRIFTFAPPTPTAPTNLTFTAVTPGSYTLNWTDSANETIYAIYRSTDGTNYTFQNTAAQNATSFAATGLTPNTNYFWQVYAVSEGALSSALAGSQASAAPGNISSTAVGGLWSATTTWIGGVVPTINDNVTISDAATVTIDTAANAFSLNVGTGLVAPTTLIYEATTARTLTVATNVTIASNGIFQSAATGTVITHVLSVGGNLTNNGVLDFSTTATNVAGAGITFTGAANNTFGGTGATTDVRTITINKGTSNANILELNPTNFTVRGAVADSTAANYLTLTNGTFKISGTFTTAFRTFTAAAYTIPATAGFWLNNPNYTVSGQAGSPTTAGLLRLSQGTYNVGTASGNAMGGSTGAVFIIEGGTMNASGRFSPQSAISYTQTAGTVNVNTVGNTAADFGSFEIFSSSSVSTISGGIINLVQACTSATTPLDYRLNGTVNITGGTLNVGTAATATNFNFRLRGSAPNVVIDNTTNNKTATLVDTSTTPVPGSTQLVVFGNTTVSPGTTLNLNGFLFAQVGPTLVNNGTISGNTASSRLYFAGGSPQTYSGSGVAGTVALPLQSLDFDSTGGVTFSPSTTNNLITNRVILFTGNVTNSNKITLGVGGTSTATVQVGNTTTPTNAGSFDVAPTFNLGTGGEVISYLRTTTARTTGNEINPVRTLTSMTYDDNDATHPLTIAGGDLTLSSAATALTLTNGRVVTNSNVLALSSGTATVTRTNGYVDGNLRKNFTTLVSKTFEVGTANAYSPVAANVTSGTGNFTVKAVQGKLPQISGTNALARYWTLSGTGLTANLTFNYLAADVTGTVANYQFIKNSGGTLSTLAPAATPTSTSAVINNVSSFSDWTLAEPTAVQSGTIQFDSATYSVNEGSSTVTLNVTRAGGSDGAVSVQYTTADGTAVSGAGNDYTGQSGTLNWAAGDVANKTIVVNLLNDSIYEGDEAFTVNVNTPAGGATLGTPSTATVTIKDNETAPSFSIDDVTHNEGDTGTTSYTFTVTKTGTTALNATVDYATADGTATDADNDYEPLSTATLTFLPGDTSKQVTVTVNGDTTFEADETFTVHLSNASGASIADADGTGTIQNDDTQNTGTFQFGAANYSVNESRASATITVTRTVSSSGAATIHYATSDGTATTGADYNSASGDLSFANGETSKTFIVNIINDTDVEPDETVTLTLSNPSAGAVLGTPNPATLTIVDNDGAAASNIIVVLPTALHGWSAFNDQTASATFVNGPATTPYGSGSYQMSTGAGDGAGLGGKSYFKTNTYNGTRLDAISSMSYSTYVDPATPGNNIAPVIEMMVDTDGNGTRNTTLVFEPIYSPEQGAIQKGVWQTWNARAGKWRSSATVGPIVPNTYFPLDTFIDAFPNATIVEWFPRADGFGLGTSVGQSSGGAWANFVGNVDGFEIGTNNASVINDYELALPAISIDDPTFVEGDSVIGPHFTVTLSGKSSVAVMVDYASADGTAIAGSDYVATSGTLTFAPNETSKDIPITVTGDTANEGSENFFMNLTNPVNATINDAQGIGTITDNDAAPSFSIDDVTHMEGNSGTTVYTFTVTKTGATTFATSVDFATVDGTATVANNDYASASGTLNFAPADTTKQITVNVNGDLFVESDETFTVHLSNESGASIADADGTGTIQNDDSTPSVVYVDDDFTGPAGSDPDGAGPATAIGYDAFPTIQGGVNGVASGGTVNVAAGTYHEDVNVNKAVNLNGAGAGVVTVSGPIGGSATAFQVTASNVQISGFTITRDGNNTTDWNNPGLNNAGIGVQGPAITNLLVHDNIITGNRTGIDVNNSNGHTIRNNVIDFNRTGFIFRNQTDNMTVVENFITNNWTVGILFLDGSGGTNSPVQSAIHSTFSNNNLSANWYGQIVDRQSGGSLPAPGTRNIKNFRGNWFGTTSPVVTTANSAEPGYAAQIPVAYGGSATAPGNQPDIAGPASANFKYIPFLLSGTDTNIETTPGRGTFGFQGVPNTVVVSPANMNGWIFSDDNPGVGTGSGGFEEGPATPPLGVGSAFLTVDAQGRHALGTPTYAGTRMDDITDLRYSSYQDNNTNTVVAPSLQFDIDYDLTDTTTSYHGRLVFEPYQSGTVQQNVWQNWDALAGKWYGTRSTVTVGNVSGVPNPCQQNTPCTWQQVLASFPNAGLLNGGSLLFKVGGPWSPGFDGNVDAFNISVNAAHVVYDFEPLANLSIDDVTHMEGNAGQTDYVFTVTLSHAIDQTATVNYATADDTATVANNDYDQANGTLTFDPGDTTKQITVHVNGDTQLEPDETFKVTLTTPSNATIADNTGVGTIQNDDVAVPGTLGFSAATYNVNENEPANHATITVNRTGGSDGQVTVDYTTSNGTAVAGSDYTTASGTLTFADGVTSQTFDVPVIDDSLFEGTETVTLTLSNAGGGAGIGSPNPATLNIVDNETEPTVSINNVTVTEGNAGTVDLVFTVSISGASTSPITVQYATADSTAHAPADYQSATGTVTFPANSTSGQSITVTANGDTIIEGNETIFVNLSNPTGATISDAQGLGTIDNDDGPTGRLAFTKNDFDGDGQTDIAVWRGDNGNWYVRNSSDSTETVQLDWGSAALGDVAVPADYDGDGKTDFAVFRKSDGNWYIIQSSTGTPLIKNWGQDGDLPVPGDYDGDNKTDVAVWRETEGNWYVLNSRDNTSTVRGWGTIGDQPVLGDFDGDRLTDIAVYRSSEGNWYIINSSVNTVTLQSWGADTDRPTPADFDGDGKTDMAVFREAGNWYIRNSTGSVTLRNWGNLGDKLVPGNYDNDAKADIAVWRPSEGTWYIINSATNTGGNYYLGLTGDTPVPAAYLR
jgi:hypothetical protein